MVYLCHGQTWLPVNLPAEQWVSGASSADGSKLVAVGLGVIYTSTNSGLDWTESLTNDLPWVAAASSWDGTKLVVAAGGYLHGDGVGTPILGPIYFSSDSGQTWTPANAPSNTWKAVACSTDGSRVVAVVGGNYLSPGPVYTSSDSGASWSITTAPLENWYSVASSADGSKLAAAGVGVVCVSSDFGTNWTTVTNLPGSGWTYICSSLDGSKLTVVPQPGNIYRSSDFGATWSQTGAPNLSWNAVACSADGTQLVAGTWNKGVVYLSQDFGTNWTPTASRSKNWTALAGSADGKKWLGVDYTEGVYTLEAPASPAVSITGSGGNLVLSWPLPSGPLTVQASQDMVDWSGITNQPTLDLTDLVYSLTVTPGGGSGFFRLGQ